MPTKRAFSIFLFAILLLAGAWGSKLVWLYFAFSVSCAILVLSYALSFFLVTNLQISRRLPESVYEEEHFNVELELRNRIALFDQSIEVEDTFSVPESSRQPKRIYVNGIIAGGVRFSYPETCAKRGRYRIGPVRVKIFEPLGLFYTERELPVYSPLTVYPRIFHVRKLPFILGHLAPRFGEQTTRISGDYEEFYGIREYQQEDGWRRIHWASTARLAELMVRHFEQSSQWNAMLVLDARAANNRGYGKHATFEYAVKVLASLAKHLVYKNASFGLIASTKNPLRVNISKGMDHFYKILNHLAVIEPDGDMPLHELISLQQWAIPQSSSLIIATSGFDSELIRTLKLMKIKMNVGIIPVIMNAPSFVSDSLSAGNNIDRAAAVKKAFDRLSSEVYFINCRDDLKAHFVK